MDQFVNIIINYKWRNCIPNSRLCWITNFDFDHALVSTKLFMWFDRRSKRMMQRRLSCSTVPDPTCLLTIQNVSVKCRNPSRLIKSVNTSHILLLKLWPIVMWRPEFLPSLCAFLAHANLFRLVANEMKHNSKRDVRSVQTYVGIARSGSLIVH